MAFDSLTAISDCVKKIEILNLKCGLLELERITVILGVYASSLDHTINQIPSK